MSKDTFYFKHDCNARTDRKLVNIIMKHGMQGIGVYWCIVEMLYEEGGYLPLEYERISFELRISTDVTSSVINDFDLFQNDAHRFWSNSVLERLQWRCDKSESARKSINKRWDKYRDTNVIRTNEVRNTKKESKEKENKGKKYSDDFLLFWSSYPRKVGKDAAWLAWVKRNGERPSISDIIKSIERQKTTDQWVKDKGQFIPHPTTWINGGRWADEVGKVDSDPFKS
jgi:hypothetical protein